MLQLCFTKLNLHFDSHFIQQAEFSSPLYRTVKDSKTTFKVLIANYHVNRKRVRPFYVLTRCLTNDVQLACVFAYF